LKIKVLGEMYFKEYSYARDLGANAQEIAFPMCPDRLFLRRTIVE